MTSFFYNNFIDLNDWFGFNGMTTRLALFHAKKFIVHSQLNFLWLFQKWFSFFFLFFGGGHMVLSNMNNF